MQDGSSSSSTDKQAQHQHQHQQQQQQQGDQHHQATAMDDFLDNIISIPSWSEASALKAHWDCNPAAAAAASSGDFAVDSAPSKLLKSSFALTEQQQQFSSLQAQELLPDTAMLHVLGSRGSLPPPIDLPRSLSEGSEPQELTAAAAWCQQYTQLDLHHSNQSGRLVSSERAPVFGNTAQTRVSGQQQTTNNPSSTSAGALKARVRARRGQATDPHSIAERLRRERIAERMKALQELVPNANKTDKASMLDEIIEYVKFLQLQVKVLSMSRLGAASFVSPLIADLPPTSSEGIQATTVTSTQEAGGFCLSERQVARLMEEDMGSAMQYLQSKGLCLMPITLASAISSPSSRASSSMTTTPTAAAGSSPQHQQQSESSK